jgi:hypothetical protein
MNHRNNLKLHGISNSKHHLGAVGGGKGEEENYVKASESNCQARTMTSGTQKSTVNSYDTIESPAYVKTIAPACVNYM